MTRFAYPEMSMWPWNYTLKHGQLTVSIQLKPMTLCLLGPVSSQYFSREGQDPVSLSHINDWQLTGSVLHRAIACESSYCEFMISIVLSFLKDLSQLPLFLTALTHSLWPLFWSIHWGSMSYLGLSIHLFTLRCFEGEKRSLMKVFFSNSSGSALAIFQTPAV